MRAEVYLALALGALNVFMWFVQETWCGVLTPTEGTQSYCDAGAPSRLLSVSVLALVTGLVGGRWWNSRIPFVVGCLVAVAVAIRPWFVFS